MDVAHCYLDGNADAVEFCPHDSMHNILAAATYTLQEHQQPTRVGSITLFNLDPDAGQLESLHHVATAGIFDIKWNPVGGANHGPVLAQADAEGCLRLYRLQRSDEQDGAVEALKEASHKSISSSSMCLCLDWDPSSSSISVGLSDGSVSILSLEESQPQVQHEWKPHDFEVWATSFDLHQPQLVYTGSDDCKFCCRDLRDSPGKLTFQNTRDHKMGVCCIAKSPGHANLVHTGSYDEHLRVWDLRLMSKPINQTGAWLGGGVWRIKPHPMVWGLVLAACMHNGFAVVDLKEAEANVIERYSKHGSLAYGGDWMRGRSCWGSKTNGPVVATCSFYDRMLRLWIPKATTLLA